MNIHAKNIFWVYLFTALGLPLAYFIRVLYANNLTLEDYGVFYGLFGFFAVFEVVRSWALPGAINFFANKHLAKEEYNQVKTLFWFGHVFRFLLSIIIGGLLFLFQDWIFATFYPVEKNIKLMFNMFLFFWITQSFFAINSAFLGIFQDQKMNGFFDFIRLILILIFSIIAFKFLDAFKVPVLVNFFAIFIVAIFSFVYILSKYTKYLIKPTFFIELPFFKKVFKFATVLIPAGLANTIFVTTDTVIIQYFQGAKDVALYTTAVATSGLLLLFFTPMQQVLNPLIAKLWHRGSKTEISKMLSLFLNHIFILFLPISLFFALFSKNILLAIFGENFLGASLFLIIFSLITFFKGLRMLFAGVLTAIGQPQKITQIVLWTGVFNLIGSLILIQFLGTLGVVLITAVSFLIAFILFYLAIHQQIQIKFDLKNFIKITILSFVFIACAYLLKNFLYFQYFQKPLWNFAFNGGIIFVLSGSVYVFLLFWTGVLNKTKFKNLKSVLLGKI